MTQALASAVVAETVAQSYSPLVSVGCVLAETVEQYSAPTALVCRMFVETVYQTGVRVLTWDGKHL